MKIVCLGQGARGMGGRLHYFIIARSTVVCQYYLEKCLKKILPEIARNGLDIHFLGVLNQSNRCRYLQTLAQKECTSVSFSVSTRSGKSKWIDFIG